MRAFLSHRLRREHGQSLALFAGGLAAICGLVGLGIDVGQLVATRTDLQKTADAAAFAGAQDLPSASEAMVSTQQYVEMNGGGACPWGSCVTVFTTTQPNDTIRVQVTRRVNYTFLRVLGLSGTDVSATARARSLVATGYEFDNTDVFPYAVWGGNPNPPAGCPYGLCTGAAATYRDNQYRNQVQPNWKNNNNWDVQSDTFKGYFHHGAGVTFISPGNWQTFSNGGNAIGQEPIDALHDHYVRKHPILVPVISAAESCGGADQAACPGGDLRFKIVAWVALKLTVDPLTAPSSAAWQGTIVNHYASSSVGIVQGGEQPPSALATRVISLVE